MGLRRHGPRINKRNFDFLDDYVTVIRRSLWENPKEGRKPERASWKKNARTTLSRRSPERINVDFQFVLYVYKFYARLWQPTYLSYLQHSAPLFSIPRVRGSDTACNQDMCDDQFGRHAVDLSTFNFTIFLLC